MFLQIAVSHIKYLEAVKEQLKVQLKGHEVHRLRNVNKALMLNRAGSATLAFSNWHSVDPSDSSIFLSKYSWLMCQAVATRARAC